MLLHIKHPNLRNALACVFVDVSDVELAETGGSKRKQQSDKVVAELGGLISAYRMVV